jgi:glyoxylase-like metal-dependent hydrolase (beta-lactamase superfamily II)
MHSSLLVSYYDQKVMIDCGEDWLDQKYEVAPPAIVLTHVHPDHAGGLKYGAPAPVYATEETWIGIEDYEIKDRRLVKHRTPLEIE